MKKRILALVMGLCMTASLVGCGNGEIANDKIRIKQYKGLEVTETTMPVTDDDVEMSIQSTLQTVSDVVEDRPVQYGDMVTIDYVGKVGGTELEEAKREGAQIKIGSNSVFMEFEQAIIGHKAGETFDINATLPEKFSEKFAGQTAVFTITLHQIEEMVFTKYEFDKRPAELGDSVVMDYLGKVDGVPFQGGEAYGATLELGSGRFIPGFEEKVVGHSLGETFDIDVTFPEDYQAAELAGKQAVFTITLHAFEKKITPELTEELLPKISETAKSVKEYKKQVREDLEASNKESAEDALMQQLWPKLLENCVVDKYPDGQVEEFVANVEAQLGEYATQNNSTASDMFKQYYGMSPEDYVKNSVKMEYAIALIAEKEKLTLTAKEYEEGVAEQAMQQGYEDVEAFEKEVGRETIELMLLQPKVGKFLVENCKIVEEATTK